MSDTPTHLPSILIVDDEPDQMFLTRRMLGKTGLPLSIVEAAGGREAIEYLSPFCTTDGSAQSAPPTVVFLDLKMPIANGFEVLSWPRNQPALSTVRVIILTSSEDPEDVKRCASLGAHGYLLKHPSSLVFDSVLREALHEKDHGVARPGVVAGE